MSLMKYRALLEAIELGNLSRAAEKLNYTQPGVSHMILSLEEEFGFPLLIRGKNGVLPTAEAQQLVLHLRQIVNGEDKLRETVQKINGKEIGVLRIGCFFSLSAMLLPDIISIFSHQCPHIELQLLVGEHGEISRWLQEGRIDVGFMSSPTPPDFHFEPLIRDVIRAALPSDHPLAKQTRVRPSELVRYPFIIPHRGSDEDVWRVLSTEGLKPIIRFRVRGDEAINAMVAKGLGVSLIPDLLVRRCPRGMVLRELEPGYHRMLGMAYSAEGAAAPALGELLSCVRRYCADAFPALDEDTPLA